MSTGTQIIHGALRRLKAHSSLNPAPTETIEISLDVLNGMVSQWEDEGIRMGCVPLQTHGQELSEPKGVKNALMDNLAIQLQSELPGTQVSQELRANAKKGRNMIDRLWRPVTIPKRKVRGSTPKGQGNNMWMESPYFDQGDEIG